jgi:hypothetical protein
MTESLAPQVNGVLCGAPAATATTTTTSAVTSSSGMHGTAYAQPVDLT